MTTMQADVSMLQTPAMEHDQSQKGNVLVEFAFILPLFLLLLFGVITFSVALYNKTVLTMATREGARAGAKYVANKTVDERRTIAKTITGTYCQNLISFGSGMTPDVPLPGVDSNNILTVMASYNYTGVYLWSTIIPISAQSSMRLE